MLADVIGCLACPHCGGELALEERTAGCDAGHSFDIARQGYVSLLPGDAHTGTADTAAMVAAREAFLAAGHFEPLAGAIAAAVADALVDGSAGCAAEVGAGTGYYLARVLDALPGRVGIALDISRYALRRAARAHPRMGAVACDVWRGLPLRSGSVAALVNVFAPRNPAEFARVLAPGGALVIATPEPDHLAELVDALGLLDVEPGKAERLAEAFAVGFEHVRTVHVREPLPLTHADAAALAAMGPSAHHAGPDTQRAHLADLPEPVRTRLSVTVTAYRRSARMR